jgi:hypothetical protein
LGDRTIGKGAHAGNFASLTSTKHAHSKYTLPSEQQLPAPLKSGLQAPPTAPKSKLTTKQRSSVLRVILHMKGQDYVPMYGWDKAGMPLYSIPCFVKNGFYAFTGENQVYFNEISQAFPKFRLMYQKIWVGFRKSNLCVISQASMHSRNILTGSSYHLA